MIKIIFMVLSTIRELIFDNKDESNITSTKFNLKKSLSYLIIIVSFLLNIFLVERLFKVGNKYFQLKEEIEYFKKVELTNKEQVKDINTLSIELKECRNLFLPSPKHKSKK
jgi:hypothetical protein